MYLDFNNMDDEQFRKEFMEFLTMYQSSIQNFMNKNKNNNPLNNPFDIDSDYIKKIFKNINKDINIDMDGYDMGRMNFDPQKDFSSFNGSGSYNPFDGTVRFKKEEEELNTLQLLDKKLRNSIINEDYEQASKIRDLINSLKEDDKNSQ